MRAGRRTTHHPRRPLPPGRHPGPPRRHPPRRGTPYANTAPRSSPSSSAATAAAVPVSGQGVRRPEHRTTARAGASAATRSAAACSRRTWPRPRPAHQAERVAAGLGEHPRPQVPGVPRRMLVQQCRGVLLRQRFHRQLGQPGEPGLRQRTLAPGSHGRPVRARIAELQRARTHAAQTLQDCRTGQCRLVVVEP